MKNDLKQKIIWDNYQGDYQIKKTKKILFSVIGKYINNDILDIGAATGELSLFLKEKGFSNIISIDPSPKNNKVIQGSINSLSYDNNVFNTVIATEVLEHLKSEILNLGLREVSRVLKAGGNFIVTVPFEESLLRNMCTCPNCGKNFHKVGHERSFTEAELKKIIEQNGFRVKFTGVYALGAMSKVLGGRFLNFIFKKLNYESISKTLIVVAVKNEK